MTIHTFVSGTKALASEMNTNFSDIVPVGSVMPWLKSFTGTPSLPNNWAECNGQVLSDAESVFDGETLPDLNGSSGSQRFLRGNTTSGTTGGSDTHQHPNEAINNTTGGGGSVKTGNSTFLPSYYEVVFIMRIK